MTAIYGSLPRVLAGFLIAPAAASVALACYEPLFGGLPYIERVMRSSVVYCLFGAYPLTLIFAMPIFFALRPRIQPTALLCIVSGALIASFPWVFFALVGSIPGVPENLSRSWLDLLEMALVGAGTGACFWFIIAGPVSRRSLHAKPN